MKLQVKLKNFSEEKLPFIRLLNKHTEKRFSPLSSWYSLYNIYTHIRNRIRIRIRAEKIYTQEQTYVVS